MSQVAQVAGAGMLAVGVVGFAGAFVGEVMYAARLLSALRNAEGAGSTADNAWMTLGFGWIASMRAKRQVPALKELAKQDEKVAHDLPRFLTYRRVRQGSFAAALFAVWFLL